MTLLATDGFETYSNMNDMASRWSNRHADWGGQYGSAIVEMRPGRFAGQSVHMVNSGGGSFGSWGVTVTVDLPLPGDFPTIFVGVALNIPNLAHSGLAFLTMLDNQGTINLDMRVNSAPTAYLTRANGATVLCTSPRNLILGNWTYFEVAANFSSTAGWAELWQDGILQASYYGTGAGRGSANGNTIGGLPSIRTVRLGFSVGGSGGGAGPTDDALYDDFYVCSNQGTRNNNVLGDCRVSTLLPNGPSADATGQHTQFSLGGTTPSATNWQSVDEPTYNQDVDYVVDNVIGHQDTYAYVDLPTAASGILAVVAQHVARKDDAGMRQINALVRQGGIDGLSPTAGNLSATYTAAGLVMEVNPVTGLPWSPGDVNAAEFGFRVTG